jgi:hypothetical protein
MTDQTDGTHAVTLADRLRIERVVWALDQRLYDLPRASRVAKRREVRANLVSAAQDVGAREALRHLGTSSQLASDYLSAELGDGPRASWVAAAVFLLTSQLLFTEVLSEAAAAFGRGVSAADPHAAGTFTWSGIDLLQSAVTFTFVDGKGSSTGGAWTPAAYLVWVVATSLVGRLWRLLPVWRRRHAAATATA